MKTTILSITLLFLTFIGYSQVTPIAAWYFDYATDQANGYVWDDVGFSAGSITGDVSPTDDRFGNPNSAYYFDGDGDYIDIINISTINTVGMDSMTISCWVQIPLDGEGTFLYMDADGYTTNYIILQILTNKQIQLSIYGSPIAGDIINFNGVNSEWYNITITMYKVSTFIYYSLYINGEWLGQCVSSRGVIGFNLEDVKFGSTTFKGNLDDIMMFDVVLDSAQIDSIYNLGNPVSRQEINNEQESIIIYPNPTTGIVNISGNNIEKIELMNLQGKIEDCIITENKIDLFAQSNGVYFIRVTTKEKVIIEKIIKN